MKFVSLHREPSKHGRTFGTLRVFDEQNNLIFACLTMELPWLENQRKISCIPSGRYNVIRRTSEKFGLHFHITNVPQRDTILFHVGNYIHNTAGCILIGDTAQQIDGVVGYEILNSRKTFDKFYNIVGKSFNLVIIQLDEITTF